jgi:hypothetical protein
MARFGLNKADQLRQPPMSGRIELNMAHGPACRCLLDPPFLVRHELAKHSPNCCGSYPNNVFLVHCGMNTRWDFALRLEVTEALIFV